VRLYFERVRVEGKETDVTNVVGMATFIKQQPLQFAVNRNLLSRVCLCQRFLTFCEYCISECCSAIQTVYLDQPTNQDFTPLKSSTVLSQCDTCHWHLKTAVHIYWRVVSAGFTWMLTAALLRCWRVTGPRLCRICAGEDRRDARDIKGKHVGCFGRSELQTKTE
jgi:hypothetical protein